MEFKIPLKKHSLGLAATLATVFTRTGLQEGSGISVNASQHIKFEESSGTKPFKQI
jgi:hypothetical protein